MTAYLLDTQALVVYAAGELPQKVEKELFKSPDVPLFISVVTPWELVSKRPFRDLELTVEMVWAVIEQMRARILAIDKKHIDQLSKLLPVKQHRNPYDRMLIAQAISEGFTLVGSDRRFKAYSNLRVLWE